MNIKHLQTLDEVLGVLIEKYLDENTPECDLEAGHDSGVEDGYNEGYNRCLDKYGLEE